MALRKASASRPAPASQPVVVARDGAFPVVVIPMTPTAQLNSALLEVHASIARVSGGIVLAFKNGPAHDEFVDWIRLLRMSADKLDKLRAR